MNAVALYPWLKALHLAAAVLFVAGLIAGTVLLRALGQAGGGSAPQRDLILALRAWQQRVTTPALLTVWGLGITLAQQGAWFASGWLQAKLVVVLLLSALHGLQSGTLRRLQGGAGPSRSDRGLAGPLTVAATIGIAVLAIVKPL